jgi:glutamyl-tRNA synthetase
MIDEQGRLTNIQDIPKHAPFFFVEPDLTSENAQVMVKKVTPEQQGKFHLYQDCIQPLTAT